MIIVSRKRSVASLLLVFLVIFLSLAGCGGGGGSGGSSDDGNSAPVANAGPDDIAEEETPVILDGSQSSDADGTITSYAWNQIAGPAVNLNNADTSTANYMAPTVSAQTVLVFRLTVTDNLGARDSDETTHTVIPINAIPVADAGKHSVVPRQSLVTLDGSQSSDADGTITSYAWNQIVGPAVNLSNADTSTPSFTAPAATELLTFKLTVTDNEGGTSSDEVSISVVQVFISEDFNDGNDGGWTKIDNTGSGFSWLVINGEYYQENVMTDRDLGDPLEQSYHVGTYSYLNSGTGFSLTNYRFSIDITPLDNDNGNGNFDQGNDVGVMFRYNNDNNYYRFSINSSNGYSRLEKKIDGTFSTLAKDSRGYIEGKLMTITVEIIDSLILIYIDEEPLFSVSDPDLGSGTIALYSQDKVKFDNVIVTGNSLAPVVVISSPVAYSIADTDAGAIDVSAIAINAPTGGKVEFVLDDGDSTKEVDSSPFEAQYEASFNPVSQGEHKLDVILRDASDSELARDTNERIGVLGEYYGSIGDSITNGYGDNYSADNISQDERTIAFKGYQAVLNDLLTSTFGYPHIIFDEAIGGDKSIEALDRVDSILERHPVSNKALILLGTNDVGNGVSASTFKQNMQELVDTMFNSGKTVWVALIPPSFNTNGTPNAVENSKIVQFNDAIRELNNMQLGPDFYQYFLGSGANRSSLFLDRVHPNALGDVIMAYLWHNELNQDNPQPLPMILENLDPVNYKQNLLEEGDYYYIDESFTLTQVPPVLAGSIWVMTANADGINTSADFLSFEVDRNVTVYVAYDASAPTLPDWLRSDFTDTGLQVDTTNGLLNLYSKDYEGSDLVSLGGNRNAGGSGTENYIVVVANK